MTILKNFISWLTTSTPGIQVKESFDVVTIEKIIKGYVWSFIDAGVAAGGAYLLGIQIGNPMLGFIVVWAANGSVNAYNEWRRGINSVRFPR